MIEKTKVFSLLEIEDVERLVSVTAGRDVKIGEMDVILIDGIPLGPVEDEGDVSCVYTSCEVCVDGEEICDDEYFSPLDPYMPDGAYIPEDYIFAFDVNFFHSYDRATDNSD